MVKQYFIPLESASAWRDAFYGIKHTFGHTWENCYAMHMTTGHKTYLYCFESETSRMVCPVSERDYQGHGDILKPFGFSGFVGEGVCPDFGSYWKEFARKQGYVCGYLGINPIFDYSSLFDADEICEHDVIHVLDLSPDVDEIFSRLHHGRRRGLKAWNGGAAELVFDRPALKKFFLENYTEFHRKKNSAAFYFFSNETLEFLLNQENVMLVGAGRDGKLEAVTLFAFTADAADALFNISIPEGQQHSSGLIWCGVKQLKALNIPLLNLGGGGGGCADFKKRFGCNVLPLKCLKQVYQADVYERLCRTRTVGPGSRSGYFPVYRQNI